MTRAELGLVIMVLLSTPVAAARLDDSLSPLPRVSVNPDWAHEVNTGLGSDAFNALVARISGFEVRLNTAVYVGKTVQIYLGLPVHILGLRSPGGMRIEWQTRGLFASSSTAPGLRSLIFQGIVTSPILSEVFDFTVHIDARQMDRELQFDPVFEIEILRP